MASLLNNASLLLNPAGSIISYQEDKIYSVLPNNGTGDFTFSGGDGGTRVNQQGYIEVTPANLITYSEDLSNGVWVKQNSPTVTSNTVLAPNGTLTADTVVIASGQYFYQQVSLVAGQTYTLSAYIRIPSGTNTFRFNTYNNAGNDFTSSVITVTSEWQRFSFTFTAVVSGNTGIYPLIVDGLAGGTFYVWGSMINIGSTALPYQPTTDRLNYPRITYQNGRGALLSEPQRTNLLTYSNILSGQSWVPYRSTYTANATTSPDGTTNASLTVWSGASDSSTGYYNTSITFAGSTTYCLSAFLKYYNKPVVNLGYADRSNPYLGGGATFNLVNGTFISVNGNATTGRIEPYKDGWYKCTVIFTTVSSPSYNYVSLDCDVDTAGEGFYSYGTQLEVGSFPTSYIPTTSATVTRPLDQYSVTNLESKGLTGTNVGTLYLSAANTGIPYQGGTINAKVGGGGNFPYNYMILDNIGSANRVRIFNGGAQTAAYTYTEAFAKIAVTADGTNSSVFINGIKKGTSSGLLAGIEEITQEAVGAGLRYTTATYTTALSDAQCQELTTVRSGSGGNISYYGPYTIHTFTGSATFTPSFSGQVEVLVVAGGGSGGVGSNGGGGGGAGGLLYVSSYGVSQGTGITVTVGAGGPFQNGRGAGTNGSNSVFGGLTTIGGGGGGGASGGPASGKNGGSGGGAQYSSFGGSGTTGQGNNGGDGNYYLGGIHDAGGGGGGAGASGLNATATNAGNGGNGLPYSISGFSTYYAGGGGGSSNNQSGAGPFFPGNGGLGGGGKGGIQGTTLLGTDGVDGLGGGSGAGVGSTGGASGAGGDGVVIVRYLT